ncbi:hypothetical protein [Streptomyces endophytica]|uniref:Uncharacterized protein n=1 Tax=Streptomyces endophytica TaxID=2991496 RepID=A0ABY6PJ68_9ACTN|nr:hypothetical protein [Streptomyces endophytica]UZJ33826.1 hypothetical protein OJ254_30655 [Streptomyces endophytica]
MPGADRGPGLKVAQARRRLTSYTAAPEHFLDELLGASRAGSSAKGHSDTADVPADAPPGRPQPPVLAPPSPQPLVSPPAAPGSLSADSPNATPAEGPGEAEASSAARPQTTARPAARSKDHGRSGRRSLLHSAQVRITAQRLREAYAASTPF